ncbi:nucleotidyl transferase AbiEii/AbiGii toxin family protein [Chitinasiproducens palmae]|uniref:Nucleotidyl transferase AbiEii toxin, Type IV TA system n=1 Tax=Chitinasiproducens palmae TaxID=1770053 RepID=A0A1H2PUG0_9BURK|nr:nucleotidyl transferase AbiEii/AbiGii toxin family protein [Chitinasiproducens palmae]SDV50808.1 Nucleotidyl transferase AbiEii toxin, Type IV TA system [Chitinasiproducens palmae]
MKPETLPSGPWEKLFPRALALIDEISRYGGIADPFWTLGGGTVLMFRYRHRLSKDIDIIVPDLQYLGFVSPRLSDTAADLTQNYTEQPGAFVRLQFEEGEVDFVASPNLLDDAWDTWDIGGRAVKVEKAAEIIAKKMYHRGDRVTARDLFDLPLVIESEPQQLLAATPFLLRHREAFLSQIRSPHVSLHAAFDAIAKLEYTPSFDHCVTVVEDFLGEL